jgi:uncharacterized protein (TIGR01777 family)
METVLISGGTGLIGKHLSKKLVENGYHVALLSRENIPGSSYPVYLWDPAKGEIDTSLIDMVDFIIHLAGANIGEKRWSKGRRKIIIDSRVKTAELLFMTFSGSRKLKAFVSASATGYYGAITSEKIFQEADESADDFLGQTCRKWEEAADKFLSAGIRTVKIRTGVVLAADGGALSKMALPVRLGFGSAIGRGDQYIPWIYIDDLCNIYIRALEEEGMSGAYNAVAPCDHTSRTFTAALAKTLKKPFWFPNIPAFVIKAFFGEMSDILLKGSRVSPGKIITAGYGFVFPDLESALSEIYS